MTRSNQAFGRGKRGIPLSEQLKAFPGLCQLARCYVGSRSVLNGVIVTITSRVTSTGPKQETGRQNISGRRKQKRKAHRENGPRERG